MTKANKKLLSALADRIIVVRRMQQHAAALMQRKAGLLAYRLWMSFILLNISLGCAKLKKNHQFIKKSYYAVLSTTPIPLYCIDIHVNKKKLLAESK